MPTVLLIAITLLESLQTKPTLEINVIGLSESTGYVMIAIYNSESTFLTTEVVTGRKFEVTQANKLNCPIDLEFGVYAVSIYHDLNSNGELDSNIFKIPIEPTGFSNNPKSFLGPPGYEKVKFSFEQDGQKVDINLK